MTDWYTQTGVVENSKLDINSAEFRQMLASGTNSATRVSPENAIRISTVYACTKVLSETIASLPIDLFELDIETGSRTKLVGDPVYNLLKKRPNDWQTPFEWKQQQMVCLCLRGNSYNYIVRSKDGRPAMLVPLPPDACSINVTAQNQINYRVTVGLQGKEKVIIVGPDDILHLRTMSMDGINGMSPVDYNAKLLGHADIAQTHARKVFDNDATPRGVLETDGQLKDDQYANLKESWESAHGGVSNSSRVALLEAGLRYKPIQMSAGDLQLLETRRFTRQEICGMYRVPPHMIMDLERSTNNNIEHQSVDFYKSSIWPWVTNIETRLDISLLPRRTKREFKFDVTELVRGDLDSERDFIEKMINATVMNPNEARARLGMNPREGGDDFASDTNNLTFGDKPPGDNDDAEQSVQPSDQDD